MTEQTSGRRNWPEGWGLPIGVGLGATLGLLVGAMVEQLALGLSVGAAIGAVAGSVLTTAGMVPGSQGRLVLGTAVAILIAGVVAAIAILLR
jgi:hypothetical protein